LLQGHHYETVSGFVCEAFGCIPRTGETIKVMLEKANREESNEYDTEDSRHNHEEEKYQAYKLEVCIDCAYVSSPDATREVLLLCDYAFV